MDDLTPLDALRLLDACATQAQCDRDTHLRLIQAVQVINAVLTEQEVTIGDD